MRRSGPESIRMETSGVRTKREERVRLSRGSEEVHTAQSQPIIGIPTDVPVPRKVISRAKLSGETALGMREESWLGSRKCLSLENAIFFPS